MSEDMESLLRGHRRYFAEGRTRDVRFRAEALRRLRKALRDHTDALCEALRLDLHKSASESYLTEIGIVLQEIARHLRRLKRWTAGRRVPSPLTILPSGSRIVPEPLGVVLIVAPWNYPVQLLLNPLVGALSAGNCAVLKSSPLVPHTEALLKRLIGEVFPPGYVSFLEGGPEVVEEVLKQRFDSIFFTGGSAFGQTVMRAAAEHLTPLTLELGGKSPCIVDKSANIKLSAKRIVFGKYLNCGQTCVAPDYIYCHREVKDELLKQIQKQIRKQFGKSPLDNKNYGKIINEKHFNRIQNLIDPAKVICGGSVRPETMQIEPTVMDQVTFEDAIMQEEIFGPVMPVLTFDSIEEVIRKVNSMAHPLALYIFAQDKAICEKVTSECGFGGGCINDVIIHLATSEMPFGGFGESGMGSYHGQKGFETFSHYKSIVDKKTWIDLPMRYQPYRRIYDKLIHIFLK